MGRVDLACASVGIDRDRHYDWLKIYPDYKQEFEAAREQVSGLLEDEATRRAYHGTIRPHSVAGKQVMVTEFSDNLLMFLLEHRNPAVFARTPEQAVAAANIQLVVVQAGRPIEPEVKQIAERTIEIKAEKP